MEGTRSTTMERVLREELSRIHRFLREERIAARIDALAAVCVELARAERAGIHVSPREPAS